MNFGLTQKQIDELKKIFYSHPEITAVIIFGSRAKLTNKKTADIDIALKGNISLDLLAKIKFQLEEETSLPYFFDVIAYSNLKNEELKREIDKSGKILYLLGS